MDEIDRRLLELLQDDATWSIAQMADQVGLSPTPCWKRIQKLEKNGVIARRVAVVDPEQVGLGLAVFVSIEAGEHTPEWMRRFSTGSRQCQRLWSSTAWPATSITCCASLSPT